MYMYHFTTNNEICRAKKKVFIALSWPELSHDQRKNIATPVSPRAVRKVVTVWMEELPPVVLESVTVGMVEVSPLTLGQTV